MRWLALVFLVGCHARAAAPDAGPAEAGGPAAARTAASGAPAGSVEAALVAGGSAGPTAPLPPPASSAVYPLFRRSPLALDELTKLVTSTPELARVGAEIAFFDPGDGSYIVRSTADRQGVVFTTQPVVWSPEPGQQVLVVGARGKAASFVAAWWILPDGGHRLASTFVMLGEVAPVALAYRPAERTLWWTSCWQCPGETGHLGVREDHHVVIVQD
jgi:hypothetical protein